MKKRYRLPALAGLTAVAFIFGCVSPDKLERVRAERDRYRAEISGFQERLTNKSERIEMLENELDQAMEQISALRKKLADTPEYETVETADPPIDDENGVGHVEISAVYSHGGEAVSGTRYSVQTKDGEVIKSSGRRNSFELESGGYIIVAAAGAAEGSVEIELAAEERKAIEIALEAGILEVDAVLAEDGPEAPEPVIKVLSTEKDIHGEREMVEGPHSRDDTFTLPAGSYLVRVRSGQSEIEKEFEVRAGERTAADLTMDAGILEVNAILEESGDKATNSVIKVLSSETDIHGERKVIEGPHRRENTFTLPATTYLVEVRSEEGEAEKEVTVDAGERTQLSISIKGQQE